MRNTIWFLPGVILPVAAVILSVPEQIPDGLFHVIMVGAVSFAAAITAAVIILKNKR